MKESIGIRVCMASAAAVVAAATHSVGMEGEVKCNDGLP